MWLENDKFKEINHAVVKGEPHGLLRLLGELLHPENQSVKNPKICPKCQKELEQKMHPYLEYFVQACPDRHGAWMSPEISAKVRDWVELQIMESNRKRKIARFVVGSVAGFLTIFLVLNGPGLVKIFLGQYQESKIGAEYWPMRSFQPFLLGAPEIIAIKNPEEVRYLTQIAVLLEEGASNRINLDTVFKIPQNEKVYSSAFEMYKKNQENFMMRLHSIYVPTGLMPFHESLQKAAEAQLAFYGTYAEEKMKHPMTELSQWLSHPALRLCNRELLKAYDFILKRYPALDVNSLHALQTRLAWFDIV